MEETTPVVEKSTARVYELAYLFVPTLEEEKSTQVFGDLKNLLETKGAQFISEEMPRLIELTYEMSRIIENKKTWFSTAYFGWIKFELEPGMLKEIEEVLARDEQLIRYMIIKTIRENTLVSKKFPKDGVRKQVTSSDATDKPEEPVVVLTPEEIDSEIDALAIE